MLGPESSTSHPDPRCPSVTAVDGPSDNGPGSIGGKGPGKALQSWPGCSRTDQFGSLLRPDGSAPRPDPHGPSVTVVVDPSDDRRVAVRRKRHGIALLSGPHGARADELSALLRPDSSAPRPDPRCPSGPVVLGPSY